MSMKAIWMDGEMVPWDAATVHVTSYGLHYGLGFFEGVRCYAAEGGPAIFRATDHLQRLRRSAVHYGLPLPYAVADLVQACKDVVLANDLTECYLRPIVFLGEGPNPLAAKMRVAVIASENGPMTGPPKPDGVRAKISSFQRLPANVIPPTAKATGQYLNSFLAQTEAMMCGFDEALLTNTAGNITDGWAHNIFVVRDNAISTPPVSAGALAGITRDSVLRLASHLGVPVVEREMVRADLYTADECFLTGTAAGVVPVVSVDSRPVGMGEPGPVTGRISGLLKDIAHGHSELFPEWREAVQ
ncbi:MAG TPA: branched-chain amino acid transaminase [Candidatus Limnocylindrales bacterium]|nr:branched-chain amino acid transaminase [Candidatus Limnocylindrales bacterium]